mmetsp:Transcript_29122/g.35371  ORF Transcript_29122/g.35371 Transcript_29122/m.35371 type:complete len:86 (-) Transcript_29122:379-636(-)
MVEVSMGKEWSLLMQPMKMSTAFNKCKLERAPGVDAVMVVTLRVTAVMGVTEGAYTWNAAQTERQIMAKEIEVTLVGKEEGMASR